MKTTLALLALAWHYLVVRHRTYRVPFCGGWWCGYSTVLHTLPEDGEEIECETDNARYVYRFDGDNRRWVCVGIEALTTRVRA